MTDEQIVMLTRSKIARLGGVSEGQLDYWQQTGLMKSTIETTLAGTRRIRLYDFTDAMTAMVLSALREHVSLQHLRQIVDHLRRLDFAVTEVRFAVAGKRVHFQLPDGTWSDFTDPGQLLIAEVLDLQPLKAKVLSAGQRRADQSGQVERRRGVHGSKLVIAGTRVPVSAVRSYLEIGSSTAEILEAYPDLTPADVETVRALASA